MRFLPFVLASILLAAAPARGQEPPAATAPPPAADGTKSVVVQAEAAASAVPAPPTTPSPPPALADAPAVGRPAAAAADLLVTLLEPPVAAAGAAPRPLPLLEALERSGDRARRLWIVQAYWKVATAFAGVRCASDAIERLELVAPGGDAHDRTTLDVATAAARADLAEARAQLGIAQQDLVDLARLPLTDPPPWPVDRPLATPYETHFDAIFASRVATGRVRAIARTLPARHEALEARAAAVRAAGDALAMAEADHAKGRRPIESVIAAHAALVGQQREFLLATRAYNLDIAEYAMAVADLSVPDDRFVSMLIGTPIQVRAAPPPAEPSAKPE